MPCAIRAPNGLCAAQAASTCCGCRSPVSVAKPTTSASVTVRARVLNGRPAFRSSKSRSNSSIVASSERDVARRLVVEMLVGEQAQRRCETAACLDGRDDLVDCALGGGDLRTQVLVGVRL